MRLWNSPIQRENSIYSKKVTIYTAPVRSRVWKRSNQRPRSWQHLFTQHPLEAGYGNIDPNFVVHFLSPFTQHPLEAGYGNPGNRRLVDSVIFTQHPLEAGYGNSKVYSWFSGRGVIYTAPVRSRVWKQYHSSGIFLFRIMYLHSTR